ncbi:spermatogenesis associated 45 [Chelydra serpentina]|uniref:Spermatogenesis associated 45 n=1 Tax=Chelydra serpentina TaxID=8475 RepID=A0A8T1SJG7_CHESE|nr:spermatogenesis associated 45 [Chelydra serpentina]
MGDAEKKRLIELNMTRDSLCMVEGKGDSTWIRPQRRHFPQSNRSSLENYKEKEPELDTGRSSWTTLTPLYHKERRHFPERSKLYTLQRRNTWDQIHPWCSSIDFSEFRPEINLAHYDQRNMRLQAKCLQLPHRYKLNL